MNILKDFLNNDIYFMETVSSKIIINDNYEGVIILDDQLNVIQKIKLMTDLVIDISFIKDKEIVLSCYENRCLVHINVDLCIHKIISLSSDFDDVSFIPFYEWINNDLLLIADNGKVIAHINLINGNIVNLNKDLLNEKESQFNDDWNKLSKFLLHKVNPAKHLAIIEHEEKIILVDYKNNIMNELNIQRIKFHDIEMERINIAQISECQISIFNGVKYIILYPETEEFRILRGKFITIENFTYLIILMCSNFNSSFSKIKKYCLTLSK